MLTFPLAYNRGLVDGRYPIIRIEQIKDKSGFTTGLYVYFKVKKVYVGYACKMVDGMRIVDAKIANEQKVLSYPDEYIMIRKINKAGRKGKPVKLRQTTRNRIEMLADYSKEKYSPDEEMGKLKRAQEIDSKRKNKTYTKNLLATDQKLAEYVESLAKRKQLEERRAGEDGIDTRLADELLPLDSQARAHTIGGKRIEVIS